MNSSLGTRRSGSAGYTLIELLAVLALVSALSTLTWINGPSLLGSGGLRNGVESIHGNLSQARQSAITTMRPSVVVIRTSGPDAWRSLATYSIDPGTSEWIPTGKWQVLPPNVSIDNTWDSDWPQAKNLPTAVLQVGEPSQPITQAGKALKFGDDYLPIGFLPDGSMTSPENVALRVVRNPDGQLPSEEIKEWTILLIERTGGRVKSISNGDH